MDRARSRQSRTRRVLLAIGAAVIGLAVVVFLFVYFVLFPTSAPKPFSLGSTSTLASATASATSPTSSATTRASSVAAAGELNGGWTVAGGSEAGYRVREKLGFLPAQSDAVGRTSSITGSATLREQDGAVTLKAASFTVAVNTLKSDRSQRDEKIHTIGLESDRYPTATFRLSRPVQLPAAATAGGVVHVVVTGVFDIHGTAKVETLPVEMRISGQTLEAVGALTFPWSEFNITAPSIGGFVNVSGKATMEFDLRLERA